MPPQFLQHILRIPIVVLLPSKEDGDDVGRALAQRRAQLLAVAPWARVIFGVNVTTDPSTWLFPLLEERVDPEHSGTSHD